VSPESVTGGDLLISALLANGIDTIFSVPGLQLDAAFDAMTRRRQEINLYHTRHEQAAAYMADGFARVTGRPACCMVVPGPGLLNAMAGLATAYACSSPVLCITGQTPTGTINVGLGLLHEIKNQLEMVLSVTKWSARASRPEDIPRVLADAIREMMVGRTLPVAVEVPPDVLAAMTAPQPEMLRADLRPLSHPSGSAISRALDALVGAERPLIMAGGGATRADAAAEVTHLAERLGAPVIMTTNGKGSISARNLLAFEAPAIPRLLPAADVVLALGTRFAPRSGKRWSLEDGQTLIKVDNDATQLTLGLSPQIQVEGDIKQVLDLILDLLPPSVPSSRGWGELAPLRAELHSQTEAIEPQATFGRAIRAALPDDAIVVDGMTQVGYWARVGFPVYQPRTFISPGYQGTLGFELPTGLGAQVAAPERRVVVVTGDGGFMYNVGELATAVQHRINLITVVFNDNAYGNVLRTQDDEYGGRRIASELHNPDFPRLAENFGAKGLRAENPEALERCLREALQEDRPTVIEVPVGMMQDPWKLIQGH